LQWQVRFVGCGGLSVFSSLVGLSPPRMIDCSRGINRGGPVKTEVRRLAECVGELNGTIIVDATEDSDDDELSRAPIRGDGFGVVIRCDSEDDGVNNRSGILRFISGLGTGVITGEFVTEVLGVEPGVLAVAVDAIEDIDNADDVRVKIEPIDDWRE